MSSGGVAVDTEATVAPGSDPRSDGRFDTVFIQEQAKDVVLPHAQERFVGEVDRKLKESAVGGEIAVGANILVCMACGSLLPNVVS